jgi:hypothetical protein
MLLGVDVVQTELKLTDDQKAKIQAINDKANTARTALFEKMRNNRTRGTRGTTGGNTGNNTAGNNGGNNAGNDADRQAMTDQMNALQKDTESALAKVLDKTQATRAAQIAWQIPGAQAFRSETLVKKLNLDEGQVTQINEVLDGARDAQREASGPPSPTTMAGIMAAGTMATTAGVTAATTTATTTPGTTTPGTTTAGTTTAGTTGTMAGGAPVSIPTTQRSRPG